MPGQFEIWDNNDEDAEFAMRIWSGEEETTAVGYATQVSTDSGFSDTASFDASFDKSIAATTEKSTSFFDEGMWAQINQFEKSFNQEGHASKESLEHREKIHNILNQIRANPGRFEISDSGAQDDSSRRFRLELGRGISGSSLEELLKEVEQQPEHFDIWESASGGEFTKQIWSAGQEVTALEYAIQASPASGFSVSDRTALVPRTNNLDCSVDNHQTQSKVTEPKSQGVFSSCTPFLNSYGMSVGKAIAATALVGIGLWASYKAYNFLTGSCP